VLFGQIADLAVFWLCWVACDELSDIVRIEMGAGGGTVALIVDRIDVDVVHCEGRSAPGKMLRTGANSQNGPPEVGRLLMLTCTFTPSPSDVELTTRLPLGKLALFGSVAMY